MSWDCNFAFLLVASRVLAAWLGGGWEGGGRETIYINVHCIGDVASYKEPRTNGAANLTITRNHWPRQVVRDFASVPPPSLETKTAAQVTFANAHGCTVAMLNGTGYTDGNGRSVLYAYAPAARGDAARGARRASTPAAPCLRTT